MNTADNLSQSRSSTSAIDNDGPYFLENDSRGLKGSNHFVCSRILSRSSNTSSSERQYNAIEARLYAPQVEAGSKRKLELLKKRNKLEITAEITAAQEKLKIVEMFETLYESKQQRSERIKKYHQGQKQIFDQIHLSLLKIMKNDKLTYLIYINLHHIDQRMRQMYHLPHTQYTVAHQPTRIHRRRKF